MNSNSNLAVVMLVPLLARIAFATSVPSTQPIDFSPVLFESGKATIATPIIEMVGFNAMSALQDAADTLKRFPNFEISIAGHADTSECAADACFELSRRRARFVADWLVAHGTDRGRINSVTGLGSRDPVDESGNEQVRARNRRVEIFSSEDKRPNAD